jgi:hypothetical protein
VPEITPSSSTPPAPVTKAERFAFGRRWREMAKVAIATADRLDPEHAQLVLVEVNSMGQVARVITGLKNQVNAKDALLAQKDELLAKSEAVANAQTSEIGGLTAQVAALSAQLAAAQAAGLDAEDERAIAEALPLIDGVSVAPVNVG